MEFLFVVSALKNSGLVLGTLVFNEASLSLKNVHEC